MMSNLADRSIMSTIIHLAKAMNLHIVAEGVENEEQLDFRRKASCDIIQGYYFSRPIAPEKFMMLLGSP